MGSTKFKGMERKRKAPRTRKAYEKPKGARSGVLPAWCECKDVRKEAPGYPVRSLNGTVRCAKCYGKVRA